MPDPMTLKVGDKVRFISIPEEWANPKCRVHKDSKRFMNYILLRKSSSRVYEIDQYGIPWIAAKMKFKGEIEHHLWGIREKTGWRKVRRRTKRSL